MTEIEHLVEALSANDELSQVQVIGILDAASRGAVTILRGPGDAVLITICDVLAAGGHV